MVHKNTDREMTYVCAAMYLSDAPIFCFAWKVGGCLLYSAILVFVLIFWKIYKVQLKQIRRVSHTWRAVSGVRQCPGRDLILSLPLIYCARHAPHGPTGVQAFCPTSLIFGCSTFCTVQVQHQLPKICSKKTKSRRSEQSPFPRISLAHHSAHIQDLLQENLDKLDPFHILQKT